MKEIEVKILEIDSDKIKRVLNKNRAKLIKKVFQQNFIYGNDYTIKEGIAVRIRKEGKNVKFAVKSPVKIVNNHKTREEVEISVGNFGIAERIVLWLGLQNISLTEIKREYWKLFNCSVEICNMAKVPIFLEIEGSEKNILKVAKLLGYSEKDYFTGFPPVYYGIKTKFLKF